MRRIAQSFPPTSQSERRQLRCCPPTNPATTRAPICLTRVFASSSEFLGRRSTDAEFPIVATKSYQQDERGDTYQQQESLNTPDSPSPSSANVSDRSRSLGTV